MKEKASNRKGVEAHNEKRDGPIKTSKKALKKKSFYGGPKKGGQKNTEKHAQGVNKKKEKKLHQKKVQKEKKASRKT